MSICFNRGSLSCIHFLYIFFCNRSQFLFCYLSNQHVHFSRAILYWSSMINTRWSLRGQEDHFFWLFSRIPITTIGIRRENVLSIFSVCETHLMNKWVCTREWTCTQQHKHKTQEERLLPPSYTILVAFLPTNNIPAYPQIIIQRKGKQIALHTWYIIFPESTPKNYTSKRFQVLEEISS